MIYRCHKEINTVFELFAKILFLKKVIITYVHMYSVEIRVRVAIHLANEISCCYIISSLTVHD